MFFFSSATPLVALEKSSEVIMYPVFTLREVANTNFSFDFRDDLQREIYRCDQAAESFQSRIAD